MPIEDPRIKTDVYELGKILSSVYSTRTKITVLINHKDTKHSTKQFLKMWDRNLESIIRQFKSMLTPEQFKVFEEQLLNDEVSLQVDALMSMIMALPPAIINEVEHYVDARWTLYANKEKQKDATRHAQNYKP